MADVRKAGGPHPEDEEREPKSPPLHHEEHRRRSGRPVVFVVGTPGGEDMAAHLTPHLEPKQTAPLELREALVSSKQDPIAGDVLNGQGIEGEWDVQVLDVLKEDFNAFRVGCSRKTAQEQTVHSATEDFEMERPIEGYALVSAQADW
jgi:hypothetical protein